MGTVRLMWVIAFAGCMGIVIGQWTMQRITETVAESLAIMDKE